MRQEQKQQPDNEPNFLIQEMHKFPALSVMVVLRRDVGYRFLSPSLIFGAALFQMIIAFIAQVFSKPTSTTILVTPLVLFAIATFVCGMYQRFRRWQEVNRCVPQHSFYLGTSPFEFSWLPDFFKRNRRAARFIDPIFCFIVGSIFLWISPFFGWWLIISGVFLRRYEEIAYETQRNRKLDLVDGLINAHVQDAAVEEVEKGPYSGMTQPEGSVRTGLGDDIQAHIRRRNTKRPPPQKGA